MNCLKECFVVEDKKNIKVHNLSKIKKIPNTKIYIIYVDQDLETKGNLESNFPNLVNLCFKCYNCGGLFTIEKRNLKKNVKEKDRKLHFKRNYTCIGCCFDIIKTNQSIYYIF